MNAKPARSTLEHTHLPANSLQETTATFEDIEFQGKSFLAHYQQYILPLVEQFEKKRVAALATLRKRRLAAVLYCAIAIAIPVGFYILFPSYEMGLSIIGVIAFLFVVGTLAWANESKIKYLSSVKATIYPEVIRFFGDSFRYEPKGRASVSAFKQTGILPTYTNETLGDNVMGSYRGVRFEIVEAKLTKVTGQRRKKTRRSKSVFNGILILLHMAEGAAGRSLIIKKGSLFNDWQSVLPNDLKEVSVDDLELKSLFQVYSNDKEAAKHTITPSFLWCIHKIDNLFNGAKIRCSVHSNQLLLAISTDKKFFESTSLNQTATFVEDIKTVLQEMQLIFAVIDMLENNLTTST